jgi:ribose/xylose/arabinose/galactoside ABC-type transport system permease subunit
MNIQRFLIGLGLMILLTGVMWPILSRIGLGRLPGDIVIHRSNVTFYFPLVTCIIVSIVVSVVFWLLSR